jgi:hypothetical protein
VAVPDLRSAPRLVATGVLLVATAVGGCADGDSGGADNRVSSVKDFCSALATFRDEVAAADSSDLAAYIRTLKEAADEVDDVGVPDDMPTEAEQGFDLTIERIQDLADDATQQDVAQLGDVSDEDQKKLDALDDYIKRACPDLTDES